MTPINGTTYGWRSSSRVAIKKSINDCTSLPHHSPSNSTHSSSINDVGKSSRNAEALTPAAAVFVPAHNGAMSLLQPPSETTQPSPINNLCYSSCNAEASTLSADVYCSARNGARSLPNPPHCSPVYGTGVIGNGLLAVSAALIPKCWDVICAPHKYSAKQPGNMKLNNLVLERHKGYKAIYAYDRIGKAEFVNQIVLEIELVGRFLSREGPDKFTLATDKLKKSAVQRRLRRKKMGSKMSLSAPAKAFLLSMLGGRPPDDDAPVLSLSLCVPSPVGKAADEYEPFISSSSSVTKAADDDFIFITPHDVSNLQTDPKLRIFKMKPPVRSNVVGGAAQQTSTAKISGKASKKKLSKRGAPFIQSEPAAAAPPMKRPEVDDGAAAKAPNATAEEMCDDGSDSDTCTGSDPLSKSDYRNLCRLLTEKVTQQKAQIREQKDQIKALKREPARPGTIRSDEATGIN